MRKTSPALLLPVLALLATACGSSSTNPTTSTTSPSSTSAATSTASSSGTAGAATKISTATIAGLGPVLVDAQGKTLYVFAPDNAKAVTCKGACAAIWPPVSGAKAAPAGAVKQSLLGADPNPGGGSVVTYAGWPLYGYVGDPGPGSANGQAKNLNGGLWYVISPSGQVIKKMP